MKKKTFVEKNLILQRLLAFAEEKGGVSEVSRSIGKHPAMFYNLISRDAKPSVETLEEISRVYKDLDFNYIFKGERGISQAEAENLRTELSELKDTNTLFRAVALGKSEYANYDMVDVRRDTILGAVMSQNLGFLPTDLHTAFNWNV